MLDGNQLGSGEYGAGAVNCFEVGRYGDCPAPALADLTFPDVDGDGVVDGATYDAMDRSFYYSNSKYWKCCIKLPFIQWFIQSILIH